MERKTSKPLHELTLDQEQRDNAALVLKKAEEYGLNPELVLPIVYAESGFRHIQQKDGKAFGVMQIEPDVAKSMKCDPRDLQDNIDCGMRLLKSHVDNPRIGEDPWKLIAAYNTKSSTLEKFLDAYDKDPKTSSNVLPQRTRDHMLNIAELYGGKDFEDLPSPRLGGVGDQNVSSGKPDNWETPGNVDAKGNEIEPYVSYPEHLQDVGTAAATTIPAAVTAGSFLSGAKAAASGARTVHELKNELQNLSGALKSQGSPSVGASATPETAPSAGAGRGIYNYAKSFGADELEARTATGMSKPEIWKDIAKANAAKAKIAQIAPEMRIDPLRGKYGLYVPQNTGGAPRGTTPPPKVPLVKPPTVPVSPSELSSNLDLAMKYAAPVLKMGASAFGAGTAGLDALRRYNKKLYGESGLSALGGAASAVSPWLSGLAGLSTGAVGTAIPLYLAASDRVKYLKEHPEANQTVNTPYDPMGAYTGYGQ